MVVNQPVLPFPLHSPSNCFARRYRNKPSIHALFISTYTNPFMHADVLHNGVLCISLFEYFNYLECSVYQAHSARSSDTISQHLKGFELSRSMFENILDRNHWLEFGGQMSVVARLHFVQESPAGKKLTQSHDFACNFNGLCVKCKMNRNIFINSRIGHCCSNVMQFRNMIETI